LPDAGNEKTQNCSRVGIFHIASLRINYTKAGFGKILKFSMYGKH
jgi:hypothetical protein